MSYFAKYGLLMICAAGLASACTGAQAQQLSPTLAEFTRRARGTVEVANVGNEPRLVSCRPQGFDTDEHGAARPHPLDPALNVRITSERVELAPGASRQISFDASPAQTPAWFLLTCRFIPAERGAGLTVAMEISSIVIIHGGNLDPRDVTLSAHREGPRVQVEVDNNSLGLARVDSGEIVGHRKQADLGTFILYPHQKRLLQADWNEANPPETVRIQIGRKRLQATVQ
jgi:hypothetical protein